MNKRIVRRAFELVRAKRFLEVLYTQKEIAAPGAWTPIPDDVKMQDVGMWQEARLKQQQYKGVTNAYHGLLHRR